MLKRVYFCVINYPFIRNPICVIFARFAVMAKTTSNYINSSRVGLDWRLGSILVLLSALTIILKCRRRFRALHKKARLIRRSGKKSWCRVAYIVRWHFWLGLDKAEVGRTKESGNIFNTGVRLMNENRSRCLTQYHIRFYFFFF